MALVKIIKLGAIIAVPVAAAGASIGVGISQVKSHIDFSNWKATSKKHVSDPIASLSSISFVSTPLVDASLATIVEPLTVNVPEGIEIRYAVSNVDDDFLISQSEYTTVVPSTLKANDRVWIKAFVKNGFEDKYSLDAIAKHFEVTNIIDVKVVDGDFANSSVSAPRFIGQNHSGTFQGLTNTFDSNTVIKYAVSSTGAEPEDNLYSEKIPHNLSMGDKVFVKAFLIDSVGMVFRELQHPKSFDVNSLELEYGFTVPLTATAEELKSYDSSLIPLDAIWSKWTNGGNGCHVAPGAVVMTTDDFIKQSLASSEVTGPNGEKTYAADTLKGTNNIKIYNEFAHQNFVKLHSSELFNVVIPSGITTIPSGFLTYSFFVSEITIPNTVTRIEDNAFVGLEGYNGYDPKQQNSKQVIVHIPDSVTYIGENAFASAQLAEGFKIPDNAVLGNGAFKNTATNGLVWKLNNTVVHGLTVPAGAVLSKP